MATMGSSKPLETPQVNDYLTLTTSLVAQNHLLTMKSVIAESVQVSSETTLIDKSPTCTLSTQMQNSSEISGQDSISKGKDCKPYWNDLCAAISLRLLLPVETDFADSDLNYLSSWSNKTVAQSWFSATLSIAPNRSLQPIFSPSFMSSVAECTDSGNMARKSKKIRVYMGKAQKALINQWIGVSRYVFNQTIAYLKQPDTRANWKAIKGDILNALPEFCKAVPYQIKSIAVKDACKAVSNAKLKFKKTGQVQDVRFRSRKNPVQSCYIPKSAVSSKGIYHTILGGVSLKEALPKGFGDCRLVLAYGQHHLTVPHESSREQVESQDIRVVAIDPGIRTFATFFSETSVGEIGKGDFSRIQRLCHHLDDLISRISKANCAAKKRMKLAASRMRLKIRNLIDELHHKAARFFVSNFDVILLPTFETSQMAKRGSRKIRSKSVRSMLTFAHYRFKQFIKHKAFEFGKTVLDVNEAYTSKTVSWTGEINQRLGGAKFVKSADGQVMSRDRNGARGIFLRALGDIPSLVNSECIC
jgi:putative transposase